MLPNDLGPAETRVLGALVEKELTTPDHYPMSLNALVNACNQASNRDPVTAFDEPTVSAAVTVLRRLGLVRSFQGSGERVPKYQHLLDDAEKLSQGERAVLAVLLLRGPQTAAELRTRAGRMIGDEGVHLVDAAIEALAARAPEPAVIRLPRRAGQKEARYAHTLAGAVAVGEVAGDEHDVASGSDVPADRMALLEQEVGELRREVAELRAQLETFRKQFE